MESSNKKRREWSCWTLREEDIRITARRMGLSQREIQKLDVDAVARAFTKGMEWAVGDWLDWLKEAIAEESGKQRILDEVRA